jgi:ParB family chromosome partitioning protein
LQQIPAYIIRVETTEEMLELALIENLQREHLNPIEVAISYRRLIEECSFTHDQLSQRISKDRSTITNFLRLLKLPETIQTALRKGDLTTGHARALINIEDPAVQMGIFEKTMKKGLSVREVERLVQNWGRHITRRVRAPSPEAPSTLSNVEDKLRQTLGTKVRVRTLRAGKGEIVIEYYSADELDRLLELFATIEA